jgi:hypothetical protein
MDVNEEKWKEMSRREERITKSGGECKMVCGPLVINTPVHSCELHPDTILRNMRRAVRLTEQASSWRTDMFQVPAARNVSRFIVVCRSRYRNILTVAPL